MIAERQPSPSRVAAAMPTPVAVTPTAPPATLEPDAEPHSYSGSGSGSTPIFRLRAGEYTINWQARPLLPSGIGCTLRGTLRSTQSPQVTYAFEGQVVPGEDVFSGSTDALSLASGDYVVEMSSDCVWELSVLQSR